MALDFSPHLNRRQWLMAAAAAATLPAHAAPGPLPQPDPTLWDPPLGPVREGYADVPGGRVWYRVVGEGPKPPVFVLHGGPAAGHRYMRPYAALAQERPVVLYDQLGCGQSDKPADDTLYVTPRYAAELDALQAHLGMDRAVIAGHSWGGWLGQYYAAKFPNRASALVLASTSATIAQMQDAANIYLRALGPKAVATAREAQRTGNYDSPAYGALIEAFYARHLLRLQPWPQWFADEGEKIATNHVYQLMNGPSEFDFSGTLRDEDYRPLHRDIAVPTLVVCGEFDYASPSCARRLQQGIRGAQLEVFKGLSHMNHIEAPARVVARVRRFIDSVA